MYYNIKSMDCEDLLMKITEDIEDDVLVYDDTYEKIINLINDAEKCNTCGENKKYYNMSSNGQRCINCYNEYSKKYMKKIYKKSKRISCDLTKPRKCKLCGDVKQPNEFHKGARYQCGK